MNSSTGDSKDKSGQLSVTYKTAVRECRKLVLKNFPGLESEADPIAGDSVATAWSKGRRGKDLIKVSVGTARKKCLQRIDREKIALKNEQEVAERLYNSKRNSEHTDELEDFAAKASELVNRYLEETDESGLMTEVFASVFNNGEKLTAIANRLDEPYETLRYKYYAALKKIKELIKDELGDPPSLD